MASEIPAEEGPGRSLRSPSRRRSPPPVDLGYGASYEGKREEDGLEKRQSRKKGESRTSGRRSRGEGGRDGGLPAAPPPGSLSRTSSAKLLRSSSSVRVCDGLERFLHG
jgi:hypothetical protein